ncbi:hypothetical protein HELRODRAFT_125565, partial [Helobdella robusta]|uniref:Sex-determining region Y protein n=1 Tax=Helobdella robusta TaxID=6412 RepID=T1EH66_HELRO
NTDLNNSIEIAANEKQTKARKVKRPPNCFFVFGEVMRPGVIAQNPRANLTEINKKLGFMWKELTEEERQRYKAEADRRKFEHSILNPGYVYRPKRKRSVENVITNR